MRLKKVEIIGFKSFADRTVMEFDAGITAIVGPNGCGKSNIADAFRWVLGEQSAKSMRGHKMLDVIFAGTANRKPLNFAEVTITLSDVQGQLPIEYEEVSVTRRLHRSGESDYFINRHPVRLKDVQDLFLDSGIGRDAFAIFEQGKIDQVINFTPLERRYIFEEAAGILRFLQRKREALRKLEQTDQNLLRVQDIHLEVEKQIIVLEQQAEKARLFKESKVRLEFFEKSTLVAKWGALDKRKSDTKKLELEQKKKLEDINLKLEQALLHYQEAKTVLTEKEKVLKKGQEDVFSTRNSKEMKVRERQTNLERLQEAAAKEMQLAQDVERLKAKRKGWQSECDECQVRHNVLIKELKVLDAELNIEKEKSQILEAQVGKIRTKQQKNQQERLRLVQAEISLESELKQNKVRVDHTQERIQQLKEIQKVLQDKLLEFSNTIKEKEKQRENLSDVIDSQKNRLQALHYNFKEISEQVELVQAEYDSLIQELTDYKARQKSLLSLRAEMEGFSSGTKRLLQESASLQSPLYQKLQGLYDFLIPEQGYEAALATAMKPYGQTLVVHTLQDLEMCLSFAQKNELRDFSIICLELIVSESQNQEKAYGDASKLSAKVSKHKLADYFLENIFIVKSLEDGWKFVKKTAQAEVWIEEEIFLDRHHVIFYHPQSENNVFLREAEIKANEATLQQKEGARQTLDAAIKTLQQKLAIIQIESAETDKNIHKEEMKLIEIDFAFRRLNGDLTKGEIELGKNAEDLKILLQGLDKLTTAAEDLMIRYEDAQKQAHEAQKLTKEIESEWEQSSLEWQEQQSHLQAIQSKRQKISDECQKLAHAKNVLEVKESESLEQDKRLMQDVHAVRELQSKIKEHKALCESEIDVVEKNLQSVLSTYSGMEKELEHQKKRIAELETLLTREQQTVKHTEKELYQFGVQSAQHITSLEAIERELYERYTLTVPKAIEDGFVLDHPLEQVEKQMRTLRHGLDELGDVNMTSIDECEKHKVRYTFLNQQMEDLASSKHELTKIIAQLDTESRKIFRETFEIIRANFKKNFQILFSGGEADLHFTDTQDVLEAGIEIIAKPPGKQMRSINLLSGGEKCLTAMALLFAIFEVKSAPFCILDEIDAPLDDSNVERFVNVVKQFIHTCQFIIITHNKRTMAIADVLCGISMEERGVSKLLSLQFSKESSQPTLQPVLAS